MVPGQNTNLQPLEAALSEQDKQDDAEVIEAVLEGRSECFNALVLKYETRLKRLAMRFVSDPSEAKDIVQEAFIRAYQGLDTFRGDSSFYTWIYRITVNTAKNYISVKDRKMLVKCGLSDEELGMLFEFEDAHHEENPEYETHLTEVKETLMHAINGMPEDLKITLTLREVSGLSYHEIAHVMHCPVGTIRSRLHRARTLISQHLDGDGVK
ncbi:MAG: RNA polymerase sigma factor RpoE [Legionellales bacterium]|nr:RNA polymerase sigma factor RpoE [Legionellales bacterium]|tara:strand:- start:1176 stop:1808 length:633 start_codon:yes stop_codon:yes gene_type:complete